MTDRPNRPPEIERLRQPHPQQAEIDATSSAMLQSTAVRRLAQLADGMDVAFAGTDELDDFEAAQDYVDGGGEDFAFD